MDQLKGKVAIVTRAASGRTRCGGFRATLADGSRPKQTDLITDKGQFR
jgi:hypothetical protein